MLPCLLRRRPGNAGLVGSAGPSSFPMIQPAPSDDDDDANLENTVDKFEVTDENDERLCALGQGIQVTFDKF